MSGPVLFSVISGGCSDGESGLVLGRPQAPLGVGGAGGTGASGGSTPQVAGEPGVVEPAGGQAPVAGADGAAGAPNMVTDPPWVAERCTPTIEFSNHDMSAQGQLFTNAVPNPGQVLWQAAHASCRLLYRDGAEVKDVSLITLIVEDAAGIASTGGNMIHLSTPYLKQESDAGVDLTQEITGVLHFATSLVYQNSGSSGDPATPRWLLVGIADFVRLESGYIDRAERRAGGTYSGGPSQATAFFLDYLTTRNPDIVYELNRALAPTAPAWSNDVFVTLMGSDIDTLWSDYQATL